MDKSNSIFVIDDEGKAYVTILDKELFNILLPYLEYNSINITENKDEFHVQAYLRGSDTLPFDIFNLYYRYCVEEQDILRPTFEEVQEVFSAHVLFCGSEEEAIKRMREWGSHDKAKL